MYTNAIAFLCSAIVCFALTPVILRFAQRRRLFDHITTSRKVHEGRVPRLGGLAIVAGFYAPLLALILYPTGMGRIFYAQPQQAFAFMFGGLAIAALGLFDDIFGAGAVEKFVVQIAVALYLWWAGFRIEHIHLAGSAVVDLGLLSPALTVLWIVGVMNALNLIDGLDGLAAGIALASAMANFVIAWFGDQPLMGLWMAALAGSLFAFLRFNFHPAAIFMGDGGALFLGYVLAVSSIRTSQKSSAAMSLLVPIVALLLPIADTLLAMGRRGLRGRPIFSGDKEHIHHRLLALGFSHRKVVLALYGVALGLAGLAVAITLLAPESGLLALAFLAAASLLTLWRLGFFRVQDTSELREQRRRNRELRGAVRSMSRILNEAQSVEEVTASLAAFAPALSAHSVRLDLRPPDRGVAGEGVAPTPSPVHSIPFRIRARFPIEQGFGDILVDWTDGRISPDRDCEVAVERLSREVARALERTLPQREPERPVVITIASGSSRRGSGR